MRSSRNHWAADMLCFQTRSAMGGVDNVVVLCGDMPFIRPETLRRLVGLHDEREACITLLTSTVAKPDWIGAG